MDVNLQRRVNRTIATVMREHGQSYVSARNYAYRAVTGLTFQEVMQRRVASVPMTHPRFNMPWEQRVDVQRAEIAERAARISRARTWAQRLYKARS